MTQTIGDLKATLQRELAGQAWSVRTDLADEDVIPTHGLGADLDAIPLASTVTAIDAETLLHLLSGSPMLRAHRLHTLEMQLMTGQLTPPAVVDWRDRWG